MPLRDQKKLVGGLYGVSLGSAFFGESMFSEMSNSSKICLVYLIANLKIKKLIMVANICVVGSRNIGSRYIQSLANSSSNIYFL